jgi:hypothetical protein
VPTEHAAGGGLDLKAFFTVIAKDPAAVTAADVLEFLAHQRVAGRWSGWRTGSRSCPRGQSPGGCRRYRACMPIWSYAGAGYPGAAGPAEPAARRVAAVADRAAGAGAGAADAAAGLSLGEADRLVGVLRTHRNRA